MSNEQENKGAKVMIQERKRDSSSSNVTEISILNQPIDPLWFLNELKTDRKKLSLSFDIPYPDSQGRPRTFKESHVRPKHVVS
jgi:hypothetical protein